MIPPHITSGAICEGGAQNAGDMCQDFKTGHLLGASPRAQFFAMGFGCLTGTLATTVAWTLFSVSGKKDYVL